MAHPVLQGLAWDSENNRALPPRGCFRAIVQPGRSRARAGTLRMHPLPDCSLKPLVFSGTHWCLVVSAQVPEHPLRQALPQLRTRKGPLGSCALCSCGALLRLGLGRGQGSPQVCGFAAFQGTATEASWRDPGLEGAVWWPGLC